MQINLSNKLKDFHIIYFETIDSTSNEAIRIIHRKQIESEKILVIADNQTEGRGKQGSVWLSAEGNIMMTIIYRLNKITENFENFSILIAEIIKEVVERFRIASKNFNCSVKFPNDLLINGKKIAGILPELHKTSYGNYLIIGIGINWLTVPIAEFGKISDLLFITKEEFIIEIIQNITLRLKNSQVILY